VPWRRRSKSQRELLPLVYEELRQLAARNMAHEASGHTLQPTALVHEAWVRLVRSPDQTWQNRAHFFPHAAQCMRRILVNHARRKQQIRHGGGQDAVSMTISTLPATTMASGCCSERGP
jgi:RNA polymerase sigma factor (TIGR02999 family)